MDYLAEAKRFLETGCRQHYNGLPVEATTTLLAGIVAGLIAIIERLDKLAEGQTAIDTECPDYKEAEHR